MPVSVLKVMNLELQNKGNLLFLYCGSHHPYQEKTKADSACGTESNLELYVTISFKYTFLLQPPTLPPQLGNKIYFIHKVYSINTLV